jgi:hypothetical protein
LTPTASFCFPPFLGLGPETPEEIWQAFSIAPAIAMEEIVAALAGRLQVVFGKSPFLGFPPTVVKLGGPVPAAAAVSVLPQTWPLMLGISGPCYFLHLLHFLEC